MDSGEGSYTVWSAVALDASLGGAESRGLRLHYRRLKDRLAAPSPTSAIGLKRRRIMRIIKRGFCGQDRSEASLDGFTALA